MSTAAGARREQQPADRAPTAQDIRAALARLFDSPDFRAGPHGRAFLGYVVEQALAGHADRLKAFDIALAALGRDASFDSQVDPIVRIEAGRLRRDLEHYYLTAGRDDPVRITIPKGQYAPAFSMPAGDPEAEPITPAPAIRRARPQHRVAGRAVAVAALCALCVLLLVAGVWRWGPWRAGEQAQRIGPAVVVEPFAALGGGEDAQLLAAGLSSGLLSELIRYDGIQVFVGAAQANGKAALPPAAVGVPVYLVTGEVDREPSRVRVNTRMTEGTSGELLWSQTFDRALTTTGIFDLQTELSGAIVGRLAQSYGAITQATAKQLGRMVPETLYAYDCVQRAFAYRRSFAKELYPAVRACLEEAVKRDPSYAAAWAMLAFAHLDAARFGFIEPAAQAAELQVGLGAAKRAVELAPSSVTALQALAALRYGTGDFEEAERVQRQVIALNPNNPESLAQLGWRLVVHGRWEEGRKLLADAISLSVVVPNWYYTTLAIALYLGGDLVGARDAADAGKGFAAGVGQATLAFTEAALGNATAARAALDEALRQSPLLARDPVAFWANFQIAPSVIERLNASLAKAGLPLPAAIAPASASRS